MHARPCGLIFLLQVHVTEVIQSSGHHSCHRDSKAGIARDAIGEGSVLHIKYLSPTVPHSEELRVVCTRGRCHIGRGDRIGLIVHGLHIVLNQVAVHVG